MSQPDSGLRRNVGNTLVFGAAAVPYDCLLFARRPNRLTEGHGLAVGSDEPPIENDGMMAISLVN